MLTREEVVKIAQLARIELKEEEITKFQKELSSILSYVEQLNAVDTNGVEPLQQVTGIVNGLRKDESRYDFRASSELTDALLRQVPGREKNFVKVKSVLKAK